MKKKPVEVLKAVKEAVKKVVSKEEKKEVISERNPDLPESRQRWLR